MVLHFSKNGIKQQVYTLAVLFLLVPLTIAAVAAVTIRHTRQTLLLEKSENTKQAATMLADKISRIDNLLSVKWELPRKPGLPSTQPDGDRRIIGLLMGTSAEVSELFPSGRFALYIPSKKTMFFLTQGPRDRRFSRSRRVNFLNTERRSFNNSETNELVEKVMSSKKPQTLVVNKDFMGYVVCAAPLRINGRVVGVVTAREWLADDIVSLRWLWLVTPLLIVISIVVSGIYASIIATKAAASVTKLVAGLETLKGDLGYRLEPMSGEFGQIAEGINAMADSVQRSIDERQSLEERVRKAQKLAALGRVAAGIAHEVRNPLTTIGGYVQYWADNPGITPSLDSLKLVNSETKRLNSLVERLLLYAKSPEVNMTSVDIRDVLSYAKDLCNAESTVKNVSIQLVPGDPVTNVKGDPHLLVQIFINLFSNAIAASAQGQSVRAAISCLAESNQVRIEVSDEGCGIAEEYYDLVFEPFFTTKDRGTGLGLAISREIVIAHGGDISFSSVLGSGTTFWVDLPIVEA